MSQRYCVAVKDWEAASHNGPVPPMAWHLRQYCSDTSPLCAEAHWLAMKAVCDPSRGITTISSGLDMHDGGELGRWAVLATERPLEVHELQRVQGEQLQQVIWGVLSAVSQLLAAGLLPYRIHPSTIVHDADGAWKLSPGWVVAMPGDEDTAASLLRQIIESS